MDNESFYSALERITREPSPEWVKEIYKIAIASSNSNFQLHSVDDNKHSHISIVSSDGLETRSGQDRT